VAHATQSWRAPCVDPATPPLVCFPSRSRLMPVVFAGTPSRDANHDGPNAPTRGVVVGGGAMMTTARARSASSAKARIVSGKRWCASCVVAAAGCCSCRHQSVSCNPPAPLSLRRCRSVQLHLFDGGGIGQVAPRRRCGLASVAVATLVGLRISFFLSC
jgi:hypothetical protein